MLKEKSMAFCRFILECPVCSANIRYEFNKKVEFEIRMQLLEAYAVQIFQNAILHDYSCLSRGQCEMK